MDYNVQYFDKKEIFCFEYLIEEEEEKNKEKRKEN